MDTWDIGELQMAKRRANAGRGLGTPMDSDGLAQSSPDAYTQQLQQIRPATPPGGAYLQDQMEQAGQAYRGGSPARAAGIAVRGAVTSPLVAVGESFGQVGRGIYNAGAATAPFFSGLTGIGDEGASPVSKAVAAVPPQQLAQAGQQAGGQQLYGNEGRGNGATSVPVPAPSPYGVGPSQPTAYGANDDFAFRDRVRGGALPGQTQGVAAGRGDQITKDYGMGEPSVVATADSTGRFNSFSQGPAGTGVPAAQQGGMTTEEANRYYGAMNAQSRANDAQNTDNARHQSLALTNSIGDRLDAEHAAWAAKVDAGSILANTPRGSRKAGLSADIAGDAASRATASRNGFAAITGPNYGAQATAVQSAGDTAQRSTIAGEENATAQAKARQAFTQQALLNPLEVQSKQQDIALGTQKQQLGDINVQQHQATADLFKKIADPKTDPKQRQALSQSYLISQGKDPAQYQIEHSNGPPVEDKLGTLHPGPQFVHVVNKVTGEVQTIKNVDAAPTTVSKADYAQMVKQHPGGEAGVQAMLKAKGLTVQ